MSEAAAGASARTGRYGQLTYTSFDPGTGAGGWQVKEQHGVAEAEAGELTARISTRLDTGPVDRFPTPEQVARLPRRLVHGRLTGGSSAYWHSAPAGIDGSGRPGNVFTHVVVDRDPHAPDRTHPVDLWRSPRWLTPFNPEQVLAARLGAEPPGPASAAPERDVVTFLLDGRQWRLGVFPALLDAVAGALAGGPSVVLGVEDSDRAAAWIAAVSHFTSAATARRLSFSTYERADGVRGAAGNGTMLICVPRQDLDLLPKGPDLVLIDEAEIVQTGALNGEPHVTERGSRIAVTPWSGLARAVTEDAEQAVAVLEETSRIGATVAGDSGRPAWPLALAVLVHDELDDGREDAAHEILSSAPSLSDHPEVEASVYRALEELVGHDAAQIWARFIHEARGPWSAAGLLVLRLYVEKALLDSAWLTNAAGVPLPADLDVVPVLARQECVVEAAAGLRTRAMAGWDTAEGELGVECLRLVDLLVRLGAVGRGAPGLPAGPMSGVEEDLDLDLERLAIPRLLDPALADDFLRRAGHLDPRTWSAWVRPLVLGELHRMSAEGGPPAGSRVPPVTLQALSVGAGSPPDDASAALDWLRTADALEEEAVLQAHAAAQQPGGSSPWSMTVLTLALRRWTLTRGAPEAEIAVVASSASPSVDDLATFAASFRGFPSALALPALKQEPSSDALARLCAELRPLAWERGVFAADARTDDGVDLLVRLRRADHDSRWWVARRGELAHAAPVVYALSVRASREVLPEVLLADDLVAQAQAAWVIAAASAGQYPDEVPRYDPSLLERVLVGRTAATVDGILQQGLPVPLAGAVFVLTVYGSPYADDARHFWKLRSVRSQIGGEVAPVLEHMLRRALASTTADLQLVTDEVSTMVRGYLATTRGRVPDAAELRGHVEATLAPLAPRPGSRGTGLGRLRRG